MHLPPSAAPMRYTWRCISRSMHAFRESTIQWYQNEAFTSSLPCMLPFDVSHKHGRKISFRFLKKEAFHHLLIRHSMTASEKRNRLSCHLKSATCPPVPSKKAEGLGPDFHLKVSISYSSSSSTSSRHTHRCSSGVRMRRASSGEVLPLHGSPNGHSPSGSWQPARICTSSP